MSETVHLQLHICLPVCCFHTIQTVGGRKKAAVLCSPQSGNNATILLWEPFWKGKTTLYRLRPEPQTNAPLRRAGRVNTRRPDSWPWTLDYAFCVTHYSKSHRGDRTARDGRPRRGTGRCEKPKKRCTSTLWSPFICTGHFLPFVELWCFFLLPIINKSGSCNNTDTNTLNSIVPGWYYLSPCSGCVKVEKLLGDIHCCCRARRPLPRPRGLLCTFSCSCKVSVLHKCCV